MAHCGDWDCEAIYSLDSPCIILGLDLGWLMLITLPTGTIAMIGGTVILAARYIH